MIEIIVEVGGAPVAGIIPENAQVDLSAPGYTGHQWSITADGEQTLQIVGSLTADQVSFIPNDNGVYTVMLSATPPGETDPFTDVVRLFMANVGPQISLVPSPSATVNEGEPIQFSSVL